MVFVSYRREDTLLAAHAVGFALRAAGHRAFVDTGSIGGGESFRQVISEALAAANAMVLLIGKSFEAERLHQPDSAVAFELRRARFHRVALIPVLVDGAKMPEETALPAELRWFVKNNAVPLRAASFSQDVDALMARIPLVATKPRRSARVLWVDDQPANNEIERRELRPHGIVFDNVVSTAEALDQLANESYDLVITDLGRAHSLDHSQIAGKVLLEHPAVRNGGPPVIVYGNRMALAAREELRTLGAVEVKADRRGLIDTVLQTLGREPEKPGDLIR